MKGTLFFLLLISRYSRWDVLSVGFCSFSLFFLMHFFLYIYIYVWRCYLIIFNYNHSFSLHRLSKYLYYHIIQMHTFSLSLVRCTFTGRRINWQSKWKHSTWENYLTAWLLRLIQQSMLKYISNTGVNLSIKPRTSRIYFQFL